MSQKLPNPAPAGQRPPPPPRPPAAFAACRTCKTQDMMVYAVLRGAEGWIEVRLGPLSTDPWLTWPKDLPEPYPGTMVRVRVPGIVGIVE